MSRCMQRTIPLMDLRRSDGVASPQLHLAILGQVFDVSKGKRHYGEGCQAGVLGTCMQGPPDHSLVLSCIDHAPVHHWYAGEGGSYHFFVGKDASRAYVTGDFQHDLNDVVEDLQPDQLASIIGWRSFYAKVNLAGVCSVLLPQRASSKILMCTCSQRASRPTLQQSIPCHSHVQAC